MGRNLGGEIKCTSPNQGTFLPPFDDIPGNPKCRLLPICNSKRDILLPFSMANFDC